MAPRFERKKDKQHTGVDADSADRGSEEEGLSQEEFALQQGHAMPDRAALSTINADVTIPLDPTVAAACSRNGRRGCLRVGRADG